jgi:hypothetical protein
MSQMSPAGGVWVKMACPHSGLVARQSEELGALLKVYINVCILTFVFMNVYKYVYVYTYIGMYIFI